MQMIGCLNGYRLDHFVSAGGPGLTAAMFILDLLL